MIEKTTIKRKPGVKPNRPIIIVGLPGIGNVGKLVVEHLRKEFDAEKFATLYSPHFPHQVVMLKNGGVRLVSNRFYLIRAKKPITNDIVLLTGDVQAVTPEGQYAVNSVLMDFLRDGLDAKFIYTIGGYNMGDNIIAPKPRVFGNATDKKIIDQFKDTEVIFGKSKGLIWGSAGLIIAFAKMKGVDGICLMGETSLLDVDASAAKAVLMQLSKKLNLKINTDNLDRIIEKTAKAVKELEKQMAGTNLNQQAFPVNLNEEKGGRPSYIR